MSRLQKRIAVSLIVFAAVVIGAGYYLWPHFRQAFEAYVRRNEIGDPDCNGINTMKGIQSDSATARCPNLPR
jgi:hypothetical protein